MATAIELRSVGKRFRLRNKNIRTWKDRLVHLTRGSSEEFWALKEIDLVVPEGSTTAILGHNGSGKSTLLKCVAGILRPSQGAVRTKGRTAALMELGAGFHPDLTGRENVYLNGSILGLARSEIDDRFGDIVSFAELEPFIDSQVKNYSSGMHARLGFAVAAHVDPDILLVDEVLAVGDEAFQRKCLDRIQEFQREGRTILLVTHDLDIVRRICNEAAVLENGKLVCHDTPGQAVRVMRESLLRSGINHSSDGGEAPSPGHVGIRGVDIRYPVPERPYILPGEGLEIAIGFQAPDGLDDLVIGIEIHDQRGNLIHGTNTQLLGSDLSVRSGPSIVIFAFEQVWLLEGIFLVTVGMHSSEGGTIYDWRTQEDFFEVMNPGRNLGLVDLRPDARLSDEATERTPS